MELLFLMSGMTKTRTLQGCPKKTRILIRLCLHLKGARFKWKNRNYTVIQKPLQISNAMTFNTRSCINFNMLLICRTTTNVLSRTGHVERAFLLITHPGHDSSPRVYENQRPCGSIMFEVLWRQNLLN